MKGFQFRDNQNVNFRSRSAIVEMEGDSFADVLIEFVDCGALRKDVFTNTTRTPGFAVVINFNLH